MIKVVLFDLDDTLISEDDYIKSGYACVAKVMKNKYRISQEKTTETEQSVELLAKQLYELYAADSKNVFNRMLDSLGIEYLREDIMELVEVYRNHIPAIEFFDDVMPLVEKLKKKGIKTGIISDGYLSTQRNKADVLQLENIFHKVILTEELGREFWKPHPRAFEIMKEHFQVEYHEMLYVGDNPKKDFYIKKYVPVKTIRIVREKSVYKQAEYLEDIKEDWKIDSLLEVGKYLD